MYSIFVVLFFLLYLFIFYFHVNDDDDDDDGHLYCAGNPCYSTHSSMLSAHWPPSQEGAGSQYKQTSNTNKQTKQTNTMIVLLSSCLLFCLRRSTCILFSLSRRWIVEITASSSSPGTHIKMKNWKCLYVSDWNNNSWRGTHGTNDAIQVDPHHPPN